uniref:LEM domain-containing protein n=1 Tax=Steinernema glaseri TaxID=37863 RepID=A0A1I8AVD2_9BILA
MERKSSTPSFKLVDNPMPKSVECRRKSHDMSSSNTIVSHYEKQHRLSIFAQHLSQYLPNQLMDSSRRNSVVLRVPGKRCSISYGYATSSMNFQPRAPSAIDNGSLEQGGGHDHQSVFFIQNDEKRLVPMPCFCPTGAQADLFVQSLHEKHREKLRKFTEQHLPNEDQYHVWIRDSETDQTTAVSIKTLENHFKNGADGVRRVKWRHLSMDRISVYRYSVPEISSRFRLRVNHFCSSYKRYCFLLVWLIVVVVICLTVVLSAMCCTSGPISNATYPINVSQYIVQG